MGTSLRAKIQVPPAGARAIDLTRMPCALQSWPGDGWYRQHSSGCNVNRGVVILDACVVLRPVANSATRTGLPLTLLWTPKEPVKFSPCGQTTVADGCASCGQILTVET